MPVTGKTILDAADIPQNSVIVPGNPTPVLMRGSTNVSTDNNSNTTTPVSFNLEQIGEVLFTLGQKIKDGSISVAIASDQIVGIQQADLFNTGVINAAQSAINGTPVAGASVILAVGQGQSSWKAQLLAGGGGFTAGTTMVVDGSPDGGTTWYAKSFKVSGAAVNNPVSSIVGPGPLELTGNSAGLTHIKVRCSVLNSTETINVRINGGAGVADVGLMGSLPSGQNNLGTLAPFVDGTVTGTVTNDNDVVAISCPGGQATAYVKITGNNVGTLLFEGTPDGGTTWDAMNAVAVGGSTVANQTTTTGAWRINVSGLTSFHVKLHPTTSGTANIRINLSQGVHNVAVTNATKLGQDVMANSTSVAIANDQTALKIKSDLGEQTGLTVNALNAALVPATDISAYAAWSLHIQGTWTGILSFQGSDDNNQYVPVFAALQTTSGGVPLVATTTIINGLFFGVRAYRYLRVIMSSYTSGTATGTLELFTTAPPSLVSIVTAYQSGTWTMQPGNTQNTTPWLIAGPTLTAAQAANTAGNVVVKGSAGALWNAVITALGTAGLDIFDNASTNTGTKLLSIPASAPVGSIYGFPGGQPAANGIVSAGVTNCPGVTFGFR
jgi:hypothetical protein